MSTVSFFCHTASQKQFEEMVEPHFKSLYRLAYRLTGNQDDAEDLVQDVLVKLYPKLSEMKAVDNMFVWLSRILLNQYIDHYRHQQTVPELAINDESIFYEVVADRHPQPHEVADSEITIHCVQQALKHLNQNQQIVLLLHEVEGYNLEEIHKMLDGVSVGTLKSRLKRARDKLTVVLKSSGLSVDG